MAIDLNSLGQTLDCGQCFRWKRTPDGAWEGAAGPRFVCITEKNLPEVLRDRFWGNYFDLDRDYGAIRSSLCAMDPALARAAEYAPEIRILNQDPWEALGSFILSQCNNIGRIRGLIGRLCRAYGESADGRAAFPGPEAVARQSESGLRALGCGYRAAYLLDAARKTAAGELDFVALARLPLEEARRTLTGVSGVGPKVADCALLYGLHRLDAFPMDVWMKRAMKTLFPGKKPEDFGEYAGIAQQYIFHYSRNHPDLF